MNSHRPVNYQRVSKFHPPVTVVVVPDLRSREGSIKRPGTWMQTAQETHGDAARPPADTTQSALHPSHDSPVPKVTRVVLKLGPPPAAPPEGGLVTEDPVSTMDRAMNNVAVENPVRILRHNTNQDTNLPREKPGGELNEILLNNENSIVSNKDPQGQVTPRPGPINDSRHAGIKAGASRLANTDLQSQVTPEDNELSAQTTDAHAVVETLLDEPLRLTEVITLGNPSLDIHEKLTGRYKEYPFFQRILDSPAAFKNFEVSNNLIFLKDNQKRILCVPNIVIGERRVRELIISHAHSILAHLGPSRTSGKTSGGSPSLMTSVLSVSRAIPVRCLSHRINNRTDFYRH